MEKYLNIIASQKILRNSPYFEIFIQCPIERFEAEKAKLESGNHWIEFNGIEDTFDKLMARLNVEEGEEGQFAEEIQAIEEKLDRLQGATEGVVQGYVGWMDSLIQ